MKHILIYGKRGTGRSRLIEELIKLVDVPIYGYYTRTMKTSEEGYHQIYMYPAGSTARPMSTENHVGDCNTRQRTINLQVFDTLGVQYLQAKADGILVMDEIGFMEEGSKAFCRQVLQCLDGEIPVLAAVKAGVQSPFLRQVLSHPQVQVYDLAKESYEEVFSALSPLVSQWNEQLKRL